MIYDLRFTIYDLRFTIYDWVDGEDGYGFGIGIIVLGYRNCEGDL